MKCFLLIFFAASAWAQGTTQTVFPYGSETVEGNTNDRLFISPQQERQQWYRASYLAQTWNSPVLITEIAFRVEGRNLDFNATTAPMEIWMQTTTRSGAELDFWTGGTQVFSSTGVTVSSPGGTGPNLFGVRFAFSDPFLYDHTQGNLVVRIVTFGNTQISGARRIDAQGLFMEVEDSPITIWGWDSGGGPPFVQDIAWIAEFSWRAVPEPSASLLLIIGTTLLAMRRRGCAK